MERGEQTGLAFKPLAPLARCIQLEQVVLLTVRVDVAVHAVHEQVLLVLLEEGGDVYSSHTT